MRVLDKITYFAGYICYNTIFWGVFLFLWVHRGLIDIVDEKSCQYLDICRSGESRLILKHLKEAVFQTYFPKKYKRKVVYQEIFTSTNRMLQTLHRLCFGRRGVAFIDYSDLNFGKSMEGLIFIGFHTLAATRRLLELAKKVDIQKLGIIAQDRTSVAGQLEANYGVKLSESQDVFDLAGVTGEIIVLGDSWNPLESHSRMVRLLEEDTPLFFLYDLPTTQGRLDDLFDDIGNLKNPSKYFIYKFRGNKLLIVSMYLVILLKRTGAKGVPIFTRRMKDGKDMVILGEEFSIGKDIEIREVTEEVYNNTFDFMSENILLSSQGWINASYLGKIISLLRKSKTGQGISKWGNKYINSDWQLSSPVIVDRYSKETFLLTSTSPLQSIKIGEFTRSLVSHLERHGQLTQKFRNNVSREKLKYSLANLWEAGIIEKRD